MESSFTQRALPRLELELELEPYLANLNVSQALEDFGRLADLVISRGGGSSSACKDDAELMIADASRVEVHPDPFEGGPLATPSGTGDNNPTTHGSSFLWGAPSSPEGSTSGCYYATDGTATPSSQWLSSSPASPSTSHHNFSTSSTCYFSSSSSCYSSAGSSSRSTLGSIHDADENTRSSLDGRPRRRQRSRTGASGGIRKRQNATAAERYRKRVKSRKCGLEEQLEEERGRRARLLASLESKMLLYREFAHLLAANTRDPSADSALAQVGSRSLEHVLESVLPAGFLGEHERVELERILGHFKCLAAASVPLTATQPGGASAAFVTTTESYQQQQHQQQQD